MKKKKTSLRGKHKFLLPHFSLLWLLAKSSSLSVNTAGLKALLKKLPAHSISYT